MRCMRTVVIVVACLFILCSYLFATPNEISYQGSLADSLGNPVADSTYSITFRIYYAPFNQLPLLGWAETQQVTTTSGQFSVILGSVNPIPDSLFSMSDLTLGITINPEEELSPRTPLLTVPYSFRVRSVDQSEGGLISGSVELLPTAPDTVGNAMKVINNSGQLLMSITSESVPSFGRGGEIVALARIEFYDPIDSKTGLAAADAAELALSKDGLILFGATEADTIVNVSRSILFADVNQVVLGKGNGATGDSAAIGGGAGNSITGFRGATIAGGLFNSVQFSGGFIGGGQLNSVDDGYGVIGGGYSNTTSSPYGVIAGGIRNTAGGTGSFVGGGLYNYARGIGSVVCGGGTDTLLSQADSNSALGNYSAILGGQHNIADGNYSTIAGGRNNYAGHYSLAAGYQAQASERYSFVWGDGSAVTSSPLDNTFTVRASGGTAFLSSSGTTGVRLPPGGGAWMTLSDSTMKQNIREVDCNDVLKRLNQLPINRWSYKSQDESIEHIGPTAQDFHRAFGVGDDETHISTIDPDGVALAAIKALNEKVDRLAEENARLRSELEALKKDKDQQD